MSQQITRYVSGMSFSPDFQLVRLLRKSRPTFLAGRLCPTGGHEEAGETPAEGVAREDEEECGSKSAPQDWHHYAICRGLDWEMNCFYRVDPNIHAFETRTEEEVDVYSVKEVLRAAATPQGLGVGPSGCSDETEVSPDIAALIGLVLQHRTRRGLATILY